MFELFAYPNTYSIGVHLLLHESGVPYRVIDVSQLKATAEGPGRLENMTTTNFKNASPHLRVPALTLPDGSSFCESGAIALYLSDTLCDGKYSIATKSTKRPEYLQWLFYLSSTLQPEVMHQFHPEYFFSDTDTQQTFMAASMQRLDDIWTILENQYSHNPWMFENRLTAVDFSLATVLLWDKCFRDGLSAYTNLSRTLEAIKTRDACNEVLLWHQRKTTDTGNPLQAT